MMFHKLCRRAFTLIELLISVVIIGILIVLVFRIYILISDISIRVENQKTVDNSMLYVSQVFENFSDKYDIDYSKYSSLKENYGLTGVLFLTGEGQGVSVYSTGDCGVSYNDFSYAECWIEMKKGGEKIQLTDKRKVFIKKFYFKVFPYENPSKYNLTFENIYHNGFGVFGQFYIKRFSQDWPYNIKMNYENFYNIRKY